MFGRKDKAPTTLVEEERQREQARREAREQEQAELPETEVHTYADGSQRIGVPPFPEKSPLEEEAELGTADKGPGARPMQVPLGMKTSGAPAPDPAGNVTESEFKARAEQQLSSDIASGKDPHTINPTTSSDKPGLANTDGVAPADPGKTVMSDDPTPEELDAIARDIKPRGKEDATDEEKRAAVVQVARETKGAVVADDKKAPAKKK